MEQAEAIAERIFDIVAPTRAGILAQLRLLQHMMECYGTGALLDERDARLLKSIAAGVERLTAGGAA